jgi:hypothetical protein
VKNQDNPLLVLREMQQTNPFLFGLPLNLGNHQTEHHTRLPHSPMESLMSLFDKAKEAAHAALEKTNDAAAGAVDATKRAGGTLADGASAVASKAKDVASGALDASKSAVGSVAATVGTAAHSASSATIAAAEKLTGKDLNKDGKIG